MATNTNTDSYTEVDFDATRVFKYIDGAYTETPEIRLTKSIWTGKVTNRGRERKSATLTQEDFFFANIDEAKDAIKALVEVL